MKRKDWKIKKLIKDTYGKKRKIKVKEEKIFMLRKLFLRKSTLLLKKNLVPNYIVYNSFLFDFLKKKNNYLNSNYIFNRIDYDVYIPTFFYSKKVFNKEFFLYNELVDNKSNYIYLNKNHNKLKYLKGNKFILFNNKNFLKNLILKNEKDEIYFPVDIKYTLKKNSTDYKLNFFLNYNTNMLINLEIYKIIILCYINLYK